MSALFVAGLASLLIGLVLGLLGGGGAILSVPLLVYLLGVEPKAAIATSLLFVGITSLAGTLLHLRAGRVRWRAGLLFGAASMGAAFLGGRLAGYVSADALLAAFTAVMLITALAMLRRTSPPSLIPSAPARGKTLLLGALVGLVSGFVGAGGGFLIVPALTLLGGMKMHHAVATSLFVITLQSFAGFLGHAGQVPVDAALVGTMGAAAVAGMLLGARLSLSVSPASLKRAFAWFVLITGLFVAGQQLSPVPGLALAALSLLAALRLERRASPAENSDEAPLEEEAA